jgi:hypothetical protein
MGVRLREIACHTCKRRHFHRVALEPTRYDLGSWWRTFRDIELNGFAEYASNGQEAAPGAILARRQ